SICRSARRAADAFPAPGMRKCGAAETSSSWVYHQFVFFLFWLDLCLQPRPQKRPALDLCLNTPTKSLTSTLTTRKPIHRVWFTRTGIFTKEQGSTADHRYAKSALKLEKSSSGAICLQNSSVKALHCWAERSFN